MFSQVSSALGEAANSKVITISESVSDKVIYNSWLQKFNVTNFRAAFLSII